MSIWSADNAGGPDIWTPRVPFQVPRVASAAVRTAITTPTEGLMVWQSDTNEIYVYTGAAWAMVPQSTAPFQVPTVADNAAKAALTATEGDVVWQADTNVLYVYDGASWVAVSPPSTSHVRRVTVTVGAENLDTIAVTITVKDAEGNAIAGTDTLLVALYNNAYVSSTANAASFPITDVGSGAIVSSDHGGVSRHICTTANGVLQLRVTDSNGASGSTLYLSVELWGDGSSGLTSARVVKSITFDGV